MIVSFIILALSAFYLLGGFLHFQEDMEEKNRREAKEISAEIKEVEEALFLHYLLRIKSFVGINEVIVQAFATRDRQKLMQLCEPRFKILKRENPYFCILSFYLPDGTSFMSLQSPGFSRKDLLTPGLVVQAVNREHVQKAAYELGPRGAFWCVVQPVFFKGEYVGAVKFGIRAKALEDKLEERCFVPVTSYFYYTKWKKIASGDTEGIVFGKYFLPARAGSLFEKAARVLQDQPQDKRVIIEGRQYLATLFPAFFDLSGNPLGGLLVLRDITDQVAAKKRFLVSSLVITVLVLGVAFSVLFFTMNRLVSSLEQYRRRQDELIKELEYHREYLEEKVGERTESLLEANRALEKEIARHKETQEKISQHESFLQSVFNGIQDGILVLDKDLTVQSANQSIYRLCDETAPLEGKKCYHVLNEAPGPCNDCPAIRAISSKSLQRTDISKTGKYGNLLWFEVFAYPVFDRNGVVTGVVEFIRDVTEKRQLEEEKERIKAQLFQVQKMEAIGTLAGGIAHDFNNMLMAIQGFVELSLFKVKEGDPIQHNLQQVHKTTLRAAELVRQLLLFSRRQPMKFAPVDLNETVRSLLHMLKRLIGENITIETDLADGGAIVYGDAGNLEQVILNLTVNARDAMEEGGTILIETARVQVDEKYCKRYPYARTGEFVLLMVKDSGCGIGPDIIDHIFEPFFSTKGPGEGTGLGLAVVYGIVKEHHGWINCSSKVGVGTTFEVYLPASHLKTVSKKEEDVAFERYSGAGQHILILEDDKQAREVCATALREAGYKVSEAESVQEAIVLFAQEGENIDLILCDVVLPDKNGLYFVEEVLQSRPDLPVIMTSGYADKRSLWEEIDKKGLPYIQKPYKIVDLLRAIKEHLDK